MNFPLSPLENVVVSEFRNCAAEADGFLQSIRDSISEGRNYPVRTISPQSWEKRFHGNKNLSG